MPTAPDFATRRFQSAAAHYLAGRPAYPEALVERTAQLLGLTRDHRLLDLGCGPGQLAIAFAPRVGSVLALDPEPAMLALAREGARGLRNVTVEQGSSESLGPELLAQAGGRLRAVLIGRAFHWMDRAETLRRLDGLIEPDGAVVLVGDERLPMPDAPWADDFAALIERWSEADPERVRRRSDAVVPHVGVLLDSAFSRLERIGIIARRTLSAEALVERALSQSSTSRARLGEAADAMAAEIRHEAEGWERRGPLIEVLASSALIARRPG